MLGADAKSLSFEESDQGFPPRLSPLFVSDEEQIELWCVSFINFLDFSMLYYPSIMQLTYFCVCI